MIMHGANILDVAKSSYGITNRQCYTYKGFTEASELRDLLKKTIEINDPMYKFEIDRMKKRCEVLSDIINKAKDVYIDMVDNYKGRDVVFDVVAFEDDIINKMALMELIKDGMIEAFIGDTILDVSFKVV